MNAHYVCPSKNVFEQTSWFNEIRQKVVRQKEVDNTWTLDDLFNDDIIYVAEYGLCKQTPIQSRRLEYNWIEERLLQPWNKNGCYKKIIVSMEPARVWQIIIAN